MGNTNFQPDFDVMFKASPNNSDKNRIAKGFAMGLTVEEVASEVRVKLDSVKRYAPKKAPKAPASAK